VTACRRHFRFANVSQDGKPLVGPEDNAFDPQGQALANEGVVEQNVRAIHIGTVPITAGPNVPLIAADSASLRVIPGGRWEFLVYLNNNSALTLAPVLTCQFTNGGQASSSDTCARFANGGG
jgi:hypothetical protein